MGVLNLANPTDVLNASNLPEVKRLQPTPEKLQLYIDRAEWIISRIANYDSTLTGYAANMKRAAVMVTENIIILDTPSFRRSGLAQLRSEQIGTYSYHRGVKAEDLDPSSKYITAEIQGILTAFMIGTNLPIQKTNVFVPRTAVLDGSGDRWYIPGDVVTDPRLQDPPVPIDPVTDILDR